MDSPPSLKYMPSPLLDKSEMPSDAAVDTRVSVRSPTSKLCICRSWLDIQKTEILELTGKGTRDSGAMPISEAPAHTKPIHKQGEQTDSPLRLALARRSVKNQIFACMDQGDKKTDIESRTGLSHQCIKWHRRLWRTECSHPRPRSKKLSKISGRGSRSPGARSERSSRRRQACDGNGDSSVADGTRIDKRRRKHRAVKQSRGRSVRTGMERSGSGGGACAERERKGSGCLAGKENVPERGEAMVMSGGLKVLPIRGS